MHIQTSCLCSQSHCALQTLQQLVPVECKSCFSMSANNHMACQIDSAPAACAVYACNWLLMRNICACTFLHRNSCDLIDGHRLAKVLLQLVKFCLRQKLQRCLIAAADQMAVVPNGSLLWSSWHATCTLPMLSWQTPCCACCGTCTAPGDWQAQASNHWSPPTMQQVGLSKSHDAWMTQSCSLLSNIHGPWSLFGRSLLLGSKT